MSSSPTFSGTYKNRLDAKGRVSLPAEFRQALIQESSQGYSPETKSRSRTGAALEKTGAARGHGRGHDHGETNGANHDKAVYAFPSPRGHRLEALCPAHFHSICNTIEQTTAMFSDDEDNLMAQIVAAARRIAFDNNGRILLPKEFLDAVPLRETAVFVGFARRFVIFSEQSHERWYRERTKRSLSSLPPNSPAAP